MDERETRTFDIELRVEKEDDKPHLMGHAAVFDKKSEDLGGFREIVKPGAFKKTIQEADIRALWNHDANYVLGRTKSKTLSLAEDKTGLAVDIEPPDTTWATDLLTTMGRGDVDQMSFGFRVVKDSWDNTDKNNIVRELVEVELFDVSPVTYPAYPQTSIAVRDHVKALQSEPGNAPHSAVAEEPGNAPHSTREKQRRLRLIERDL